MLSKSKQRSLYFCLAADAKPSAAGNGDALIEMDTGKAYLYDAENSTWRNIGGETGAAVVGTAIVGTDTVG